MPRGRSEGRLSVVIDMKNIEHQFHTTMLKTSYAPVFMGSTFRRERTPVQKKVLRNKKNMSLFT